MPRYRWHLHVLAGVCGARFLSKTKTAIGMHAMHMAKHGFRNNRATVRAHTVHYPGKVRTPPMVQRAPPTEATSLSQFRSSTHLPYRVTGGHGTAVGAKTQVSTMTSTVKYMSLSLPSLLRRLQEALKVSRLLSHSPASFAACRRLSKSPDSSASLRKLLFEVVSSRSGESNSCTLPPPRSRIRS